MSEPITFSTAITMSAMALKTKYSDVTFLCGPLKEPVKAHRCILAAYSEVLDTLFSSQFRESGDGVIHLPDFDQPTVSAMVKLLYTGSVPAPSHGLLTDLFALCHMYAISAVLPVLEAALGRTLTDENAMSVYVMGQTYSGLLPVALKYIRTNPQSVFRAESSAQAAKSLELKEMLALLKDEKLASAAADIWNFVKGWAAAKEKEPQKLKDRADPPFLKQLLSVIPLDQLSEAVLLNDIRPKRLISDTELLDALAKKT